MTTKIPVCADVCNSQFLSKVKVDRPVISGHGNLEIFCTVYRTFSETGPAEFVDYAVKVLPKYYR